MAAELLYGGQVLEIRGICARLGSNCSPMAREGTAAAVRKGVVSGLPVEVPMHLGRPLACRQWGLTGYARPRFTRSLESGLDLEAGAHLRGGCRRHKSAEGGYPRVLVDCALRSAGDLELLDRLPVYSEVRSGGHWNGHPLCGEASGKSYPTRYRYPSLLVQPKARSVSHARH